MVLKLLFLASVILYVCVKGKKRHKIVAYWGQNSVYHSTKQLKESEKDLSYFCRNSDYDVIVLAFMHVFFDGQQKDEMPDLNFSNHCWSGKPPKYPRLLQCPKIEQGIKDCQERGKQVILSLGGATENYGIKSGDQAKLLAETVWDLVLGGDNKSDIRPFGSAILDGIDLDIEKGPITGYTQFVRTLHGLMDSDNTKDYIITAAPQCVYPDKYMGPATGKPLIEVPGMLDELYVQFYNNYCYTGTNEFYENLQQWVDTSAKDNGPLIFVGVPADVAGARSQDYRTPEEIAQIYKKIKDYPRFGGFMLWDASLDQNNMINGKRYSEHIASIIGEGGPTVQIKVPVTLPQHSTTSKPSESTTSKPSESSTNEPKEETTGSKPEETSHPIIPSKLSCDELSDGTYAHPTDCTKFFECFHHRIFVKSCPPGLKFNPAERYCDWPKNVNCP